MYSAVHCTPLEKGIFVDWNAVIMGKVADEVAILASSVRSKWIMTISPTVGYIAMIATVLFSILQAGIKCKNAQIVDFLDQAGRTNT